MTEINFGGANIKSNLFNTGINNKTKQQLEAQVKDAVSDFKPEFGNILDGDTVELSTNKSEDDAVIKYAKSQSKGKSRGKSFAEINKEEWDKRGGAQNYNGKGAEEMGFSVMLSTVGRWIWSKIFG